MRPDSGIRLHFLYEKYGIPFCRLRRAARCPSNTIVDDAAPCAFCIPAMLHTGIMPLRERTMGKSFNPLYRFPSSQTGPFVGEADGDKIIKDIKGLDQSQYGGWWPSFFPTSVGFLVTGDSAKFNVMTVACIVVVNAHPFMIGMPLFAQGASDRGDGPRYSLELLERTGEYTMNIPYISDEMTKRAIICGSLSGRDGTDKFAKAGFTPVASRHVGPPSIKECPLNLECRVHTVVPLGSHKWVIGEVEAVHLDADVASGERHFFWRSMPELMDGKA